MATKPFTTWTVKGTEYKLRLTTRQVTEVETRIGMNLLKVFAPSGTDEFALPPLKVMLIIVHGALQKFQSNISLDDLYDIFDDYVDTGGNQADFMADVLLPMLENSGFFPKKDKQKVAQMEVVE